jgi:DNA-binding transcriptional ArsR family regulator
MSGGVNETVVGMLPDGSRLPDVVAGQVADAMFALSTPSRVQILWVLMEGSRGVGEITELLGMEQSAVSHQLRVLREHGLIGAERVGRRRVYALRDEHVVAFFEAVLRHVQHRARTGTRFDRSADAGWA